MACCQIKAGKHTKIFSQLFGIPLFKFMEIKEEFVGLFWILKWLSIWQFETSGTQTLKSQTAAGGTARGHFLV
uniref:Uncharacterized protein n=1 Tax=Romanomermis culicivorax TaxID=13658 RepID=A0A915K044_ROMCU